MYAIVEIAGQQFKVEKDQRYFVHQLQGKEGEKVVFDNVLLLDDKGKISVGAPAVKGAQVTAKIEKHLKGDKVIVFKKKRRKGYAVKNGHRQRFSEISIQSITTKVAKKATDAKVKAESSEAKAPAAKTAKAATKTTTAKKETAKAPAAKTVKATATKKAAPKKAAPKKAAPKKAAPKKEDK
ncbi:MAG: 50S ribosomal protein L21 [Flavobacteriales bacterium]|nr:50S ribosomal protein L21 [Flavobacteriales bacterium]|tara:strand:- start:502 stop:1047 length:546 start_codon:yes stop_codon:yes gene_type:complete